MRLSINLFMSLNGVSQAPGGTEEDTRGGFMDGGWLMSVFDEGCGQAVTRWFDQSGALLLGRRTYDLFASHWPQVTDPNDVVAHQINTAQKYVVTSSQLPEVWSDSSTRLEDDFLDEIRRLKGVESDRELQVHGSIQLARALHQAGLVDIYRFLIAPVTVGPGFGIFDAAGPSYKMKVQHGVVTTNGVFDVELVPEPFGERKTVDLQDGKEIVRDVEEPRT